MTLNLKNVQKTRTEAEKYFIAAKEGALANNSSKQMLQLPMIRPKQPLSPAFEILTSQQYFSKTDNDQNELAQAIPSMPSIARKRFVKSLLKANQFFANKNRTPKISVP